MNNEQKSRIVRLDFSKYNIPQYLETANKSKGYINYGGDNLYPEYLISLISKSSLHASILKSKASFIGGQGWLTNNLDIDTMMFLKNFRNENDLDEILQRVSYDFELYGGFALNIIWSQDRKSIAEINYIEPSKVRIQIPEDDTQQNNNSIVKKRKKNLTKIENYFISDGWENEKKYPPKLYSGFSTFNRKEASQILYVKDHRAGSEFYAQPEYLPGVNWIELEWEISSFHINNIKNGFHPCFHLNVPIGQTSDEEMDQLVYRIKNQFGGALNAGEPFVTFNEGGAAGITFEPIESNGGDKKFITLMNESVERGILHAHRVTNPEIFGVDQSGKGGVTVGGKSSYIESMEIFQNSYVSPKQQTIEKVFNRLSKINGIKDRLYIQKYSDQYRKVDTNMQDVLSILEAQILPVQKYELLVANQYTHEVASKLSQYDGGNSLNPKPETIPTNTTPVDNKKPSNNVSK